MLDRFAPVQTPIRDLSMEEISSLEDLLDLQVLDSDIDRLLDRRTNLPELDAYRVAHDELSGIEQQLAELSARMREIDLASDKSDGELKLEEAKAHREEQRLYAGGLTARDVEFLRAEVEMLRRRISTREDELFKILEEKDRLETSQSTLTEDRDAVAAEKDRIEEVVSATWREIDGQVALLETRKSQIFPQIVPELIGLYEEIRPSMEGVAVARLGEGVCGGCHLTLSAAEQIQAVREFPPRCLHCRRILVPQ